MAAATGGAPIPALGEHRGYWGRFTDYCSNVSERAWRKVQDWNRHHPVIFWMGATAAEISLFFMTLLGVDEGECAGRSGNMRCLQRSLQSPDNVLAMCIVPPVLAAANGAAGIALHWDGFRRWIRDTFAPMQQCAANHPVIFFMLADAGLAATWLGGLYLAEMGHCAEEHKSSVDACTMQLFWGSNLSKVVTAGSAALVAATYGCVSAYQHRRAIKQWHDNNPPRTYAIICGGMCLVVVAGYLAALFLVDQAWCEKNIVPPSHHNVETCARFLFYGSEKGKGFVFGGTGSILLFSGAAYKLCEGRYERRRIEGDLQQRLLGAAAEAEEERRRAEDVTRTAEAAVNGSGRRGRSIPGPVGSVQSPDPGRWSDTVYSCGDWVRPAASVRSGDTAGSARGTPPAPAESSPLPVSAPAAAASAAAIPAAAPAEGASEGSTPRAPATLGGM